MTIDEIPQPVLIDCCQLVKANSIEGCKKSNVKVCMASIPCMVRSVQASRYVSSTIEHSYHLRIAFTHHGNTCTLHRLCTLCGKICEKLSKWSTRCVHLDTWRRKMSCLTFLLQVLRWAPHVWFHFVFCAPRKSARLVFTRTKRSVSIDQINFINSQLLIVICLCGCTFQYVCFLAHTLSVEISHDRKKSQRHCESAQQNPGLLLSCYHRSYLHASSMCTNSRCKLHAPFLIFRDCHA